MHVDRRGVGRLRVGALAVERRVHTLRDPVNSKHRELQTIVSLASCK